jgi:hypothetical protein
VGKEQLKATFSFIFDALKIGRAGISLLRDGHVGTKYIRGFKPRKMGFTTD